jgi:hypothetical protein
MSARAAELRVGGHYAGHLLFTDMVAAEAQWAPFSWPERRFAREIDLQAGLALSFDGRFVEVPALVRVEVVGNGTIGFQLASGVVLSRYDGTSALTPTLCAGVPVTTGRLRLQPEWCGNLTVKPGVPTYLGGFWTGLGVGIFYAL